MARAGQVKQMMELFYGFRKQLRVLPTSHIYGVLHGGFASIGRERRVEEVRDKNSDQLTASSLHHQGP